MRWSPENAYHYEDYISEQRPKSWDDPGSSPQFTQRVSCIEVQLSQQEIIIINFNVMTNKTTHVKVEKELETGLS